MEELFDALTKANKFIHPEWEDVEVIFNSIHAIRSAKSHKKFALYVNSVCKTAIEKFEEVAQLETQMQLHTDNNN
jgi:hypothetical protein